MANPISWRELHEKFVDAAVKFPDFQACWNGQLEQWTFEGGPALAEETFKEAARLAAMLLREKGLTAPYWDSWLNVMREQRRGFAVVPQAATWRAVQDVMAGGGIDSRFRPTKNGYIKCVFQQSADFCLDLEPLSAADIARQQTGEVSDPQVHLENRGKSTPSEQGAEKFSEWAKKRSAERHDVERGTYANSWIDEEIRAAYPLEDHEMVEGKVSTKRASEETGTNPTTTLETARQRRGPKADYETAQRVKAIVDKIAPEGNWKSFLQAICKGLDEKKIGCPKTWKKKHYSEWSEVGILEKPLVTKAIEHHLKNARKALRETLA